MRNKPQTYCATRLLRRAVLTPSPTYKVCLGRSAPCSLHSSRSLRFAISGSKVMHRQRGLTLVELLVAISILGLVAVMGWRGLDSIVRSRTALNLELEQTRGMQLAFAQMQSDTAHLAPNSLIANRPALHAQANHLTLVRTVFADAQPTRVQVVSYRVTDGQLTRRESPATRDLIELDKLWLAALNNTDSSPAVLLENEVSAMTLRVWLNGGAAWQPSMDATVIASLANGMTATGVEVVLQLPQHDNALIKVFLLGAV
jgi:general secretion pathway protein J